MSVGSCVDSVLTDINLIVCPKSINLRQPCGSCLKKMKTTERDAVFTRAFNEINSRLNDMNNGRVDRRVGELKIRTYYNDIQKYKKYARELLR